MTVKQTLKNNMDKLKGKAKDPPQEPVETKEPKPTRQEQEAKIAELQKKLDKEQDGLNQAQKELHRLTLSKEEAISHQSDRIDKELLKDPDGSTAKHIDMILQMGNPSLKQLENNLAKLRAGVMTYQRRCQSILGEIKVIRANIKADEITKAHIELGEEFVKLVASTKDVLKQYSKVQTMRASIDPFRPQILIDKKFDPNLVMSLDSHLSPSNISSSSLEGWVSEAERTGILENRYRRDVDVDYNRNWYFNPPQKQQEA
jgi:hypothetical protein